MRKTFLCVGGDILSVNDGQGHYIHAGKLPMLYRVNPEACLFAQSLKDYRNDPRWIGMEGDKLIVLRPRDDGAYHKHCPYVKVPSTEQVIALAIACNKVRWVSGNARAIFADALQDADYQDELLLADLRSSSSDIDLFPFIRFLKDYRSQQRKERLISVGGKS